MSAPYTRPLSAVERVWLIADQLTPPFVNQLVLEGTGELHETAWRCAAEAAAQVHPGSRLRRRGLLARARWVAGETPPPVRTVDAANWTGHSEAGAEFLREPLPPKTGPTVEIILATGPTPRVVVRSHHAVMDGRGHLLFVDDLFRSLRGEPLHGAAGTITDHQVAAQLEAERPAPRAPECLAPTGTSDGDERGITWQRRTLPGRQPKLLPRLSLALANAAHQHGEGLVRFDIPVDMRPRVPEAEPCTANLTGMLHLAIAESDDAAGLAQCIRDELAERAEARFVRELGPARGVPLWLMRSLGRRATAKAHRTNRWIASGALSNLGKLDHTGFHGGGFRVQTSFFIPPGTDGTALFAALTGTPAGVELCVAVPRRLATGNRLTELLDRVEAALRDS